MSWYYSAATALKIESAGKWKKRGTCKGNMHLKAIPGDGCHLGLAGERDPPARQVPPAEGAHVREEGRRGRRPQEPGHGVQHHTAENGGKDRQAWPTLSGQKLDFSVR